MSRGDSGPRRVGATRGLRIREAVGVFPGAGAYDLHGVLVYVAVPLLGRHGVASSFKNCTASFPSGYPKLFTPRLSHGINRCC